MKTVLCIALCSLGLATFAQENNTWRLGVQLGAQGNTSDYSGGMEIANGRFNHNSFGAGALNFVARYDINKHWMLRSGMGVNSFGFEFSLTENYSLLNSGDHQYSAIRSEFGVFEIPVMAYYKFNTNCKNSRLLLGAGFAGNFVGAKSTNQSFTIANSDYISSDYLTSTATTSGGSYLMLRFAVEREKVFKKGNMLNVGLLFNCGLQNMANATVNYTMDGQQYTHEFTNNGSFVGLRLAYFFKPNKHSASIE